MLSASASPPGNSETGNIGDGVQNVDGDIIVPLSQRNNDGHGIGYDSSDLGLQFPDVRTLMFWNFIHSSVLSVDV